MNGFVIAGRRKQVEPKVNQHELAKVLGCEVETLKDVERGATWPPVTDEGIEFALAQIEAISAAKANREVTAV